MTRVWQESLTHTTHIQITFLLRVIQTGNPNGPQRAKRALGSSQGLAYTSRAALAAPPDAHGTIDTCTAAKSGTRDPQNSKGSCGLTWTLRNTRCATRGTQYCTHITSGARDAGAAHISGVHAQPNAAAAAGTGVGGAACGTRPQRHLRPTAARRVHAHNTSTSFALCIALTRPVVAKSVPISVGRRSGANGSVGSTSTWLSATLPARRQRKHASDMCACVRVSPVRGTDAAQLRG